jgi:hypothetical protein
MPEKGGRNADKGAIRELCLSPFYCLESCLVHNHFVEPSFDETTCEVLELFAYDEMRRWSMNLICPGKMEFERTSLHQQETVFGRELDGNAFAVVSCPDVETWVT